MKGLDLNGALKANQVQQEGTPMIDEARLAELLLTWEERFEHGEDLPAETLCPDDPELAEVLAQQISKLRKTMWVTRRITVQPEEHGNSHVPMLPARCQEDRGCCLLP